MHTYISKQSEKLPEVSFKHEIMKMLSVVNVCRGMCPKLQTSVAPLQGLLKVKELPSVANLSEITYGIWTYVLSHNTSLFLCQDPGAYHLMVDCSAKGVGYALFEGHPVKGFDWLKLLRHGV